MTSTAFNGLVEVIPGLVPGPTESAPSTWRITLIDVTKSVAATVLAAAILGAGGTAINHHADSTGPTNGTGGGKTTGTGSGVTGDTAPDCITVLRQVRVEAKVSPNEVRTLLSHDPSGSTLVSKVEFAACGLDNQIADMAMQNLPPATPKTPVPSLSSLRN